MYVSPLTSPLLDDDRALAATPIVDEHGQPLSCGYVPRDWDQQPAGSIEFCESFPSHLRIPRSEWRDRIEQREKDRSTLKELALAAGIKTVSQNGTNHCWAFGSVRAVEIVEAIQGETHVPLSPTAVACKAKSFRNVGGNTFSAIPVMSGQGIPTAEAWPLNKLDRKLDTSEAWRNGERFKLSGWFELKPNDFDAMASQLLHGWPVTLGLAWWSHMICGVDLKALAGGKFGVEIWNSHGASYGDNGFAVLSESKGTAFDQASPFASAI